MVLAIVSGLVEEENWHLQLTYGYKAKPTNLWFKKFKESPTR